MTYHLYPAFFRRNTWKVLLLLTALVIFFLLNLFTGSVTIPFRDALNIFFSDAAENVVWQNILLKSRLPQAVTALTAGAALAVSGLQMQTLFRNPLAGPSVLGISSGASLGVALVVLLFQGIAGVSLMQPGWLGSVGITAAAFAGAMGVLAIIIMASRKVSDPTVLLIIGIMIGYAGASLVGVLKFYSDQADLKNYVIWGLGSFSNVSSEELAFFVWPVLLMLLVSLLFVKPMNLYLLGERYAQNLGVNISRIRLILILLSGMLVAITTAYTGPIAFLGLAVPHIARNFFITSDHRRLLPLTMVTGAVIALMCNAVARMPGFDGALPINTITSILGAPIVIWVIMKQKTRL
ncbi:MAG: iron chelate uptake ABC transporter family permease subunit [Bacteroidota bacterium]